MKLKRRVGKYKIDDKELIFPPNQKVYSEKMNWAIDQKDEPIRIATDAGYEIGNATLAVYF